MMLAIAQGNWAFVVTLLIWWLVSRTIKVLPHLRRRPAHILLMPIFIVIAFAMALVKIQALVTIKQQKWLTRQVEVIDGQVVRTGEGSLDETGDLDETDALDVPVGPIAQAIA